MTDTNAPVAWIVTDTWENDREIARFSTRDEAMRYCNELEPHTTTDWRFIPMPLRGAFA